MPSVTKMYDVPPSVTMVSAGRRVTTKTGAWKEGSSPHGADAEAGHPTPDDQRTDAAEVLGLKALGLGGRPALEHPCVQRLAAVTHWRLRADAGPAT